LLEVKIDLPSQSARRLASSVMKIYDTVSKEKSSILFRAILYLTKDLASHSTAQTSCPRVLNRASDNKRFPNLSSAVNLSSYTNVHTLAQYKSLKILPKIDYVVQHVYQLRTSKMFRFVIFRPPMEIEHLTSPVNFW